MDPRFLAMLSQGRVAKAHMDALGEADCDSAALFGHVASTEIKFLAFIKGLLLLDPDARPLDAIPVAKLTLVWEACRKRTEVEQEADARRAVDHLPPQLSIEDHQAAREAFEKVKGRNFADHKIPSENYFERKVGEVESVFKAERLSAVTNVAQEVRQKTPGGPDQTIGTDGKGALTVKNTRKDFYVPMPADESSLRNRFDVMGANLEMLRMRYISNPILASASLQVMKDYVEYLCGERVWGFVVKGSNNAPLACPHIGQVMQYDQAIRELQAKLMKGGMDFKSALEKAMADEDTRILHFTTAFGMEAHTAPCRALTAPGLNEIYANINRGQKRPLGNEVNEDERLAAKQRKRAKLAEKKKKDKGQGKGGRPGQQAIAAPPAALAIQNGSVGDRGKGKGKKGEGKSGIPKGIKFKNDDKIGLCFAYNKKEKCVQEPCNFAHECWWCLATTHPGGEVCTCL